ncbi:EthD family reductase [Pseudaminobacter soli (ex Li et al. 2025)]|uniref:EthD family reductase n=1 Tax=Pseudaminobacter soli (ex Li et al. 2025) TaxID=1295366 RepID=A0A2P7SMG0_9HYPH|nr:EthD family reductase [Mesorhizobium soli]PSJ63627.1 EthD family reductase [Mesorhizobium soli]
MAKLIVMYGTPKDPAAFDRYYFSTHVPLARKIPGLEKYEISEGAVASSAGPAPYYLVAVLHFSSITALEAALASPEGQAAAGDIPNFADGGADLFFFDSKEV